MAGSAPGVKTRLCAASPAGAGTERDGRADPGEVLVEVDAEHLPPREAAEVQPEREGGLSLGAEEHHPHLDLHAAPVGRAEARGVRDPLLQAPLAPLPLRD